MGTDCHLYVEVKPEGHDRWRPLKEMSQPYKGPRDYPLFAVLADQRNGATRVPAVWQEPKTVTGPDGTEYDVPRWLYDPNDGGFEHINPICAPKGIPEDATLEWMGFCAMWEAYGATWEATWLTFEEIQGADWDQMVIRHGLITEEEYIVLQETGAYPTTQAGGAGGEGLLIVTEEEYAEGMRGELSTMVNASWSEGPLSDRAEQFLGVLETIMEFNPAGTKVRFMLLFES